MIMDYEKKYKEALDAARYWHNESEGDIPAVLEEIFPELIDEDERIRKEIIDFATKANNGVTSILANNYDFNKWLAWLEKQSEQKPQDESALDGQVKDSINSQHENKTCKEKDDFLTCEDDKIRKEIRDFICWATDRGCITKKQVEKSNSWLAWLDKQASTVLSNSLNVGKDEDKVEPKFKVGDVLHSSTYHLIWIYKDDEHYYACVNTKYVTKYINGLISIPNDTCPATKEQRDLLFRKMKEAGYEWDAEKKELKKIEQKPAWSEEDKNFMYDTLSNLTELKDRYGEGYGNVGKCIDWLRTLKSRIHDL